MPLEYERTCTNAWLTIVTLWSDDKTLSEFRRPHFSSSSSSAISRSNFSLRHFCTFLFFRLAGHAHSPVHSAHWKIRENEFPLLAGLSHVEFECIDPSSNGNILEAYFFVVSASIPGFPLRFFSFQFRLVKFSPIQKKETTAWLSDRQIITKPSGFPSGEGDWRLGSLAKFATGWNSNFDQNQRLNCLYVFFQNGWACDRLHLNKGKESIFPTVCWGIITVYPAQVREQKTIWHDFASLSIGQINH